MKNYDKHTRNRYIAMTAMLGALSFVLQFLGFSIPFLIPEFIKFDFSDLPALIAAFSMGPISGVAVALIKNVTYLPIALSNPYSGGWVGPIANFMLTAVFVGVAGFVYHRRKTRSGALIGSLSGTLFMSVISVPINLFITYPCYYLILPKETILRMYQAILPFVDDIYTCLWLFNAPFNLLKGLVVSLITFLIYKRISPLIKGQRKE